MHKLLTQLKERRIWRVLVAYPSMTFVLLQVVEFFINNYELDARYLTAGIILAVVLLPAAVVWNWRHGEVGQQPIAKTEIGTYFISALAAVAAIAWYWSSTPADLRTARQDLEPARSVAVMPFENIGGDAEAQYLCDGIAESLINWLATIPDVRVVSKGAAFRLRDKMHDTAALAAELGVESVITGNLVRNGDKVLVSASMVDLRNDSQIWGARMVQPSEDVIYLERSIVAAIKDGLRLKVTDSADALIASGGTDNPKAYGLGELRQAIRTDPKFARPYADIADTLSQMLMYGLLEGEELLGEARNAAYTAIALAPGLAEAHTALASIHQNFDFDWDATDAAFQAAIAEDPQAPGPYHRYADFLILTFQFDKAKEMARRALAKDASDGSALHALGFANLAAGDFEAAARTLGDWNRFHPASRWSYVKHAVALSLIGECDSAARQAGLVENMNDGKSSPLMESWLAWSYKNCGRIDLYTNSIERIRGANREAPDPLEPGLIYAHALEGDIDALVDSMVSLVDNKTPLTIWVKYFSIDHFGWGVSGEMMKNPRYLALLEKLDYPPGD
jgi:TolB-like protein